MSDLIRGKVARILNSRELALNVGSDQGARVGMIFDVTDPNVEEIADPDTKEVIGSLERPKIRVKVVEVQAKLSRASTYKKWRVNVGGTGFGEGVIARAMRPPKWETRYETVRTRERTWEALDEKESFVATGDPVVEVRFPVDEDDE